MDKDSDKTGLKGHFYEFVFLLKMTRNKDDMIKFIC